MINLPGQLPGGVSGAYILSREDSTDPDATYEDDNAFGDLDLDSGGSITIRGTGTPGPSVTISSNDRVFHLLSGTVRIERTTITGGTARAGDNGVSAPGDGESVDGQDGDDGGCVLVASGVTATLDQVSVNNCATQSGGNGAAPATMDTAGGNAGNGGNGGGVANFGTLTVTRSFFYGNGTGDAGSAANGTAGSGSAVAGGNGGNGGNGGALFTAGDLTVEETTIIDNTGGDPSQGADGTNSGDNGYDGEGGSGGGIAALDGAEVTLRNTIVASNTAGDDVDNDGTDNAATKQPGSDLFDGDPADDDTVSPNFPAYTTGSFTDGGNNLIGSNNTVDDTFADTVPGTDVDQNGSIIGSGQGDDATRVDPGTDGTNQNEDYAVEAVVLASSSPAVDAGVNTDLDGNEIRVDGRGFRRPGTADGDETVDIGGFELDSEPVTGALVINEIDSVTAPSSEDDRAEFVEIKNTGSFEAQLADYALVLYSGDDDTAYASYNLSGALAPGETVVVGDPGVTNVSQVLFSGTTDDVQDREGAVGLYLGKASDYPIGAVAGQNASTRVDVVVYDNGEQESLTARLLDASSLAEAFGQSEEDVVSGDTDNASIQRNENGSYSAGPPTAGEDTGGTSSPSVTISVDPTELTEGETTTLTATLSEATTSDVVVDLDYSSGDVTGPASVTIPAGDTSADVTLTAVTDNETEGEETVDVSVDAVSNGVEDGEQSVEITVQDGAPSDDVAEVEFALVQSVAEEGDGQAELTLQLSDLPEMDATVTVTLVSGDPADLGGFTSETIDISSALGAPTEYTVTIPVTDDGLAEENESFVFELTMGRDADGDGTDDEQEFRLGDRTQTVLVIVDNDGNPATASVPIRDENNDGVEDGGRRLLALPIGGVTAGELADDAGGDVLTFDSETGTFTPADDADMLMAGQPVVVDVAPGAEIELDGTTASGTATFRTSVVDGEEGADDSRVLVTVGNPTEAPLTISDLKVSGGTLADVALVFDAETGGFRPVSLDSVDDPTLPAFGAAVLQVIPDGDAEDVSVSTAPSTDGGEDLTNAIGEDLTEAPTEGALVVTLNGDDVGDVLAVRFDGEDGLDPNDGIDVESPAGATLAALDEGFRLASIELDGDLVEGETITIPLFVTVPTAGDYSFSFDSAIEVDGQTVLVELLDNGVPVGPDVTFSTTGDDLDGRFALRLTVQGGVATGSGPDASSVGPVFPNPTAGVSAVEVTVAETETVRVAVYDVLGREVVVAHDGPLTAGTSTRVALSGRRLAPGTYVVRVDGETFAETRRLTVTR